MAIVQRNFIMIHKWRKNGAEKGKLKAPMNRGLICGWVSKYREIKFPTQYY